MAMFLAVTMGAFHTVIAQPAQTYVTMREIQDGFRDQKYEDVLRIADELIANQTEYFLALEYAEWSASRLGQAQKALTYLEMRYDTYGIVQRFVGLCGNGPLPLYDPMDQEREYQVRRLRYIQPSEEEQYYGPWTNGDTLRLNIEIGGFRGSTCESDRSVLLAESEADVQIGYFLPYGQSKTTRYRFFDPKWPEEIVIGAEVVHSNGQIDFIDDAREILQLIPQPTSYQRYQDQYVREHGDTGAYDGNGFYFQFTVPCQWVGSAFRLIVWFSDPILGKAYKEYPAPIKVVEQCSPEDEARIWASRVYYLGIMGDTVSAFQVADSLLNCGLTYPILFSTARYVAVRNQDFGRAIMYLDREYLYTGSLVCRPALEPSEGWTSDEIYDWARRTIQHRQKNGWSGDRPQPMHKRRAKKRS